MEMSSNSWPRIFATAPIVSALRGREGASGRGGSPRWSLLIAIAMVSSALQVAQLVLADLNLVAVLELVRLDPPAVHVGAVQRSEVVDVVAVLAVNQQRVVARDGDVVEEHPGVRSSPDRNSLGVDREALARAPAARADHERSPRLVDLFVDVHRLVLAGLVDPVGHRRGFFSPLWTAEVRTALLAVVGALGVDEPALGAVNGHASGPSRRSRQSSSSPAGSTLPRRMSVRVCTSLPEISEPPASRLDLRRLTSSARRMSILPCSRRRLEEPSRSSSLRLSIIDLSSSSLIEP